MSSILIQLKAGKNKLSKIKKKNFTCKSGDVMCKSGDVSFFNICSMLQMSNKDVF